MKGKNIQNSDSVNIKDVVDGKVRKRGYWNLEDRFNYLQNRIEKGDCSFEDIKYVQKAMGEKKASKYWIKKSRDSPEFYEQVNSMNYTLNDYLGSYQNGVRNAEKAEPMTIPEIRGYKPESKVIELSRKGNKKAGKVIYGLITGLAIAAGSFFAGYAASQLASPSPNTSRVYSYVDKEIGQNAAENKKLYGNLENKLSETNEISKKIADSQIELVSGIKNLGTKIDDVDKRVNNLDNKYADLSGKIVKLDAKYATNETKKEAEKAPQTKEDAKPAAEPVQATTEPVSAQPAPPTQMPIEEAPQPKTPVEQAQTQIADERPILTPAEIYNMNMARADGTNRTEEYANQIDYEIERTRTRIKEISPNVDENAAAKKMIVREYAEKGKTQGTAARPGREEKRTSENLDKKVNKSQRANEVILEERIISNPQREYEIELERIAKSSPNDRYKNYENANAFNDYSGAINDAETKGKVTHEEGTLLRLEGIKQLNETSRKIEKLHKSKLKNFFSYIFQNSPIPVPVIGEIINPVLNLCNGIRHMAIPREYNPKETDNALTKGERLRSGDGTRFIGDLAEVGADAAVVAGEVIIGKNSFNNNGKSEAGGINGGEEVINGGEEIGPGGL